MEMRRDLNNKTLDKSYEVVLISREVMEIIKEKLGNDVLWIYDEDTNQLTIINLQKSVRNN